MDNMTEFERGENLSNIQAELDMPPSSKLGMEQLLNLAVENEMSASIIGSGKYSTSPEKTSARHSLERTAEHYIFAAKLSVSSDDGSGEAYVDSRLKQIREKWSRLGSAALQQDTDTPTEHNGFEPGV